VRRGLLGLVQGVDAGVVILGWLRTEEREQSVPRDANRAPNAHVWNLASADAFVR